MGGEEQARVRRDPPEPRSPWTIAREVWREAVTDRTMLSAGGLAFFALFGLLPAIAAVGALYALAVSPETIEGQIVGLEGVLPDMLIQMLRELVTRVAGGFGFGLGLLFNLAIVLWTVQRSASGIITALNLVHDTQEQRDRLHREGAALAIAAGSLLFLAVSLFMIAIVPLFAPALAPPFDTLLLVVRWPLLALLFLLYIAGVYRIAPAEPPRRYRWISVGALVALGLWLAASGLFSLYISVIGGFSPYYGSATAPVVLLAWLFISSWVVMIGAEVNEQIVEAHEGKPHDDVKEKVDRA